VHNELHHTLVYQMWWNFYCTRYQSDSFSFIDMGNGFHCLRNFFQSCPAASAFGLQNKECRFPSSGQGNPNTTSLRNRTLMKCACHFDRQGKRQKKVSKTHAGSKSHSPLVGEDKSSYHQTGRPKKQAYQNSYHQTGRPKKLAYQNSYHQTGRPKKQAKEEENLKRGLQQVLQMVALACVVTQPLNALATHHLSLRGINSKP